MGYTFELWAVRPDEVLAALAAPSTAPPSVEMPDETRQAWAELGPAVATVLRDGGGGLVAEYAHYVAAAIRSVGFHYGSLDHTSSGGEEFRRRFLSGPAADRYGRDAVALLRDRALGGLTWEEYPRLGHLEAGEVAAAAQRIASPSDTPTSPGHPEDIGQLLELDKALGRAAGFGLELHSIYG